MTVLYKNDTGINSGYIPGTQDAGNYDLLELLYTYDLSGKPIQYSSKINPQIPNTGFGLLACDTTGTTMQFVEKLVAFSDNGLNLSTDEHYINFLSTGTTSPRWYTAPDPHLRVIMVIGYTLP